VLGNSIMRSQQTALKVCSVGLHTLAGTAQQMQGTDSPADNSVASAKTQRAPRTALVAVHHAAQIAQHHG
jgi:hypothetical protein